MLVKLSEQGLNFIVEEKQFQIQERRKHIEEEEEDNFATNST